MDEVVGGCILRDDSVPRGRSAVDGRQRPVASTTTTITSLAGHLPPFRTIKLARQRRCWIVEWSHQCLHGSLLLRGRSPS